MKWMFGCTAVAAILLCSTCYAQNSTANKTKGQAQSAGGPGVFGTIYTLNSGFNYQIIKARYTVAPYPSYDGIMATPDEKLLVLTIAIKNSMSNDLFFGGQDFQAVDETGAIAEGGDHMLASLGSKSFGPTLKPGQGVGQAPAADELTVAIKVPAKAHITKIILKNGRKIVPNEEVIRYFVAGAATSARDGAEGNPKNIIAPLPDYIRDPTDKTGATPLAEPTVKLGQAVPSGYANYSVESVAVVPGGTVNGNAPADGKQFIAATLKITSLWGKDLSLFDTQGNDSTYIKTADGDKIKVVDGTGPRKVGKDEAVPDGVTLKLGETYTYRLIFEAPKDAKLTTLTFGKDGGHNYNVDVSTVK